MEGELKKIFYMRTILVLPLRKDNRPVFISQVQRSGLQGKPVFDILVERNCFCKNLYLPVPFWTAPAFYPLYHPLQSSVSMSLCKDEVIQSFPQ